MRKISLLSLAVGLWALVACQVGLATPLPVQDRADIVSSYDGQFWVDGAPLRFVGYNIRGFAHYGGNDILPYSSSQDQITNAQAVAQTGARVIRVFGPNRYISNQEVGDRLQRVLDIAAHYGFYVIYDLTDYYNTGFNPMGDDKFYTDNGGWIILNQDFFAGGYQENYLPQVRYLVNRFKDSKALFCWELGNEVKNPNDPQTFYNFCSAVHQAIRDIDQNHMISIGLISTYPHTGWTDQQAVAMHSMFDFITVHTYNGVTVSDYQWASSLHKPLLVEEAGFSSGDRPQETDGDIAKWVNLGARG